MGNQTSPEGLPITVTALIPYDHREIIDYMGLGRLGEGDFINLAIGNPLLLVIEGFPGVICLGLGRISLILVSHSLPMIFEEAQ